MFARLCAACGALALGVAPPAASADVVLTIDLVNETLQLSGEGQEAVLPPANSPTTYGIFFYTALSGGFFEWSLPAGLASVDGVSSRAAGSYLQVSTESTAIVLNVQFPTSAPLNGLFEGSGTVISYASAPAHYRQAMAGIDALDGQYMRIFNGNGTFPDSTGERRILVRIAPQACSVADLAEPYGMLDFSDVSAFLSSFAGSDPVADLAAPMGVWDFSDVAAFLTTFAGGCP